MSERSKLITRQGYYKLKEELNDLWRVQRPDITKKVAWAASLGDRSENADYIYNKKLLRQIDRRVRFIRKRLDEITVVDYAPSQEGKVFFGAWVEVENDQDEVLKFRIVGKDEIYDRKDHISIESPMAHALIGKEEEDEVRVRTPEGVKIWYVVSIEYVKDDSEIRW